MSFGELQPLFGPTADVLEIFDEKHSDDEDRFLLIGPIARGVVIVVYTEVSEDSVRIISARPATRGEKELYRRYLERTR